MFTLGKKLTLAIAAVVAGLMIATSPAMAASYTLFGDAEIVPGGNPGNAAQLRSDSQPEAECGGIPCGGVDFAISPTAWSDFDTLSTDYNVTDDDCGGGSPRFTLGVDTTGDNVADGYVHVAIGPSPSFTDCALGWQSTGNLIGNEDAGRYDYSQFGGSPFTTYSDAPASVENGKVVEVFVVVDGSWNPAATGGDGEQTVLVDNVNVDGTLYTFEPPVPTSKDDCKKGGWQSLTCADGSTFKNQGDCIQYANTGK